MAVNDFSATAPPMRTRAITLSAVAGTVDSIITPSWCRRLSIRFETPAGAGATGTYSSEGASEDLAIDANHQTVSSGALQSFNLNRAGVAQDASTTTLVASSTASAVCRVTMESGAT